MAYLQIPLEIRNENRAAAAGVDRKYRTPVLTTVAQAYLDSPLFTQDVVAGLKPYLNSAPDVRIFDVME